MRKMREYVLQATFWKENPASSRIWPIAGHANEEHVDNMPIHKYDDYCEFQWRNEHIYIKNGAYLKH